MIQFKDAPAFCLRVAERGEESGNLSMVIVHRVEVWACDPKRTFSCFDWSEDDKKIRPFIFPTKCVAPRMQTGHHKEAVNGSSLGVHPCSVSRSWRWRKRGEDGTHVASNSSAGGMIQTYHDSMDCASVRGLYNGAKVELAPCHLSMAVELQWLDPSVLAAELDDMNANDASKSHYHEESRELGRSINRDLRKEGEDVPEENLHWDTANG